LFLGFPLYTLTASTPEPICLATCGLGLEKAAVLSSGCCTHSATPECCEAEALLPVNVTYAGGSAAAAAAEKKQKKKKQKKQQQPKQKQPKQQQQQQKQKQKQQQQQNPFAEVQEEQLPAGPQRRRLVQALGKVGNDVYNAAFQLYRSGVESSGGACIIDRLLAKDTLKLLKKHIYIARSSWTSCCTSRRTGILKYKNTSFTATQNLCTLSRAQRHLAGGRGDQNNKMWWIRNGDQSSSERRDLRFLTAHSFSTLRKWPPPSPT